MELAGEKFGELLAQGQLSYKEFGKFLIVTALDIAEKMILLSLAEMTAKKDSSKSICRYSNSSNIDRIS